MSDYSCILLAIDLTDEAQEVTKRALAIQKNNDAELHLIHVIEPLSFAYGGDIPMDFSSIQDEIQKQAENQLNDFAEKHNIESAHKHLRVGKAETEIHELADEINADLIVIGSHGRHGLALLLGSTANGVLHGATCDVLAVRIARHETVDG